MTTILITGATRGLGHETARAEIIVRMATLGSDGATGTFVEQAGTVPW
jgi:NAD(P)-dependent dehydrogenase (short-subunit alcohol dehydrogenase family)